MSTYEIRRAEKIAHNQALLRELGLNEKAHHKPGATSRNSKPPTKKRKLESKISIPPTRASARIAATPAKPVYNEEENERASKDSRTRRGRKSGVRGGKAVIAGKQEEEDDVKSSGNSRYPPEEIERLRGGWSNWEQSAPLPTRAEDKTFHFEDYEDFTPNKSPEEMLREGAFGGTFFRPLYSRTLGITIEDDWKELPEEWTQSLNIERFLTSTEYDPLINKYGVSCGQSIEEWEAAGWIRHEYDVRGWAQWYFRFFQGRRCDDDERQISRWKKCVGKTGRWRRILLKKYVQMGIRTVADEGEEEGEEEVREVSPVVHQTCHHWAWEVRQDALDEFWETGK